MHRDESLTVQDLFSAKLPSCGTIVGTLEDDAKKFYKRSNLSINVRLQFWLQSFPPITFSIECTFLTVFLQMFRVSLSIKQREKLMHNIPAFGTVAAAKSRAFDPISLPRTFSGCRKLRALLAMMRWEQRRQLLQFVSSASAATIHANDWIGFRRSWKGRSRTQGIGKAG